MEKNEDESLAFQIKESKERLRMRCIELILSYNIARYEENIKSVEHILKNAEKLFNYVETGLITND